jgi:glucose-6-phosphate dehydrogenase assembly protein OpcA
MPSIFDALPGIEVPVGAIAKSLADLWVGTAASGAPEIETDDAKATQVNLVLHLGLITTVDGALAQFQTVVEFSKRYPSRIVVLCPQGDDTNGAIEMRAKINAECHLGKSKTDKRCVEFVMLSYSRAARRFLENQVSICLSTDLPLYYWAHRFSASARLADYRYLLGRAKRVLIDSAIAPADALVYAWPNPNGLRDLVYSRLLPVRQTIGQFLSSYEPAALVGGLRGVTVGHNGELAAEGRVTLAWLQRRLAACGADVGALAFATAPLPVDVGASLGVRFEYDDRAKFLRWTGDLPSGHASLEADFGTGRTTLSAAVSLLAPEMALSEAMFF